jgi:hypothetical protein
MSLNRYNARRDATEPAIREALRDVGAEFIALDKFDLLVLFRGKLTMLDCKVGHGKKGTITRTKNQETYLAQGFPLKFAVTPEEALAAIGAVKPKALDNKNR